MKETGSFPSTAVPIAMPDYGVPSSAYLRDLFLLLQYSSIPLPPPKPLICFLLN